MRKKMRLDYKILITMTLGLVVDIIVMWKWQFDLNAIMFFPLWPIVWAVMDLQQKGE